uniref:RHS repeat-associated core domain-containing protein n=1 Tax=Frankia sp. Cj5 TaxID=2880978 RepID=UPI00272E65DB
GDLAWQARTTLWGASPPPAAGDLDCPLRFPGQYHDPETGLNYNYHRYYDPETARYDSTDPLGLAPAPNPHTYVHNPLGWLDPLGLAPYVPNAANSAPTVVETETIAPRSLKPNEAVARWDEFLGDGPTTNLHPRTGLPDANRIVSADGTRSIRFGPHEMGSSPTKFHYHEETWNFDKGANTWFVDNVVVRVPFPKGAW